MSVTQPEFQHAEPANRLLRLWTFWWQHWPEPFEIGLCKGVSDSAEQRSKGQQANIYAKHSCVGMYEYVASKSWAKLSCISGEDRGWRGHGKNPETEVHTVRERTGRHYLAPPSRASLAVTVHTRWRDVAFSRNLYRYIAIIVISSQICM